MFEDDLHLFNVTMLSFEQWSWSVQLRPLIWNLIWWENFGRMPSLFLDLHQNCLVILQSSWIRWTTSCYTTSFDSIHWISMGFVTSIEYEATCFHWMRSVIISYNNVWFHLIWPKIGALQWWTCYFFDVSFYLLHLIVNVHKLVLLALHQRNFHRRIAWSDLCRHKLLFRFISINGSTCDHFSVHKDYYIHYKE